MLLRQCMQYVCVKIEIQYVKLIFLLQVGGKISAIVRSHMKLYGRVSVCGAISTYNATSPTLTPSIEPILVFKQLRMEGFLVQRWFDRHDEGTNQMLQWIKEVS